MIEDRISQMVEEMRMSLESRKMNLDTPRLDTVEAVSLPTIMPLFDAFSPAGYSIT